MISDIDECKAETHNCGLNAFCNNTETTARVKLGTWETDGTVKVIDYYIKQFLVDWDRILLNVSLIARA